MCGILGITIGSKNKEVVKAIENFKYRGPDDTGVWSDSKVSFANVRLAIIDPQTKSNQPLFDDAGEIGVVFNGEIFNYKDVKAELAEFNFETNSDTEMIIYAYKKWGLKCFEKFYGMFAICIYDIAKQKVILARDGEGIKPLYYYLDERKNLLFSSEIIGITKFYSDKFELNYEAIEDYFTFGYFMSPNTLFSNIHKLEKRSLLSYDLNSQAYEISNYAPYLDSSRNDLDTIIENSCLKHLESDVPVGLFFSGGIDSSLIASYLNKNKINLKCFTIKMDGKDLDDYYSEEISKKLKLNVSKYTFNTEEFDETYKEVMSKISEPFSNAALLPTYYLGKIAASEVKVVLSGTGGDEYFLGYDRNRLMEKLKDAHDYKMTSLDNLYCSTPKFYAKRKIFEFLFTLFRQPTSIYLLNISFNQNINSWRRFKLLVAKNKIRPIHLDREFYLENDLLKYLDASTSLASIEGRVPLVTQTIRHTAETYKLPFIQNNETKFPLKELLTRYIPKELVFRKKSGFGLPLHKFYKESTTFRGDFGASLEILNTDAKIAELIPKNYSYGTLDKFNPYLTFAIVGLAHSIKNCQASHTQ